MAWFWSVGGGVAAAPAAAGQAGVGVVDEEALGAGLQRLLESRQQETGLEPRDGDPLARACAVKAGGRGVGRVGPRRQRVADVEEAVFEAPGEGAARRGRQALLQYPPGLQETREGGGLGEQVGRQAPGGAALFRRPPSMRPTSRSIRERSSQCAADR